MDMKLSPAYLPRRPGVGRRGKPIELLSNFFEVSRIPGADIIQYDVQIKPVGDEMFIQDGKRLPRQVNHQIMELFFQKFKEEIFSSVRPGFDGVAQMYSPRRLPFETRTEIIELAERRESFSVKLSESAVIDMAQVASFQKGEVLDVPKNCIQCLDVVMRTMPSISVTMIGNSFFSGQRRTSLDAGSEIWMGYYQSVRPAHGRILVNIDTAAAVFHKAQPLTALVGSILGVRDLSQVTPRDRNHLRSEITQLKVEVTHRGNQRRKYRIRDVAREDATQHSFEIEEEDGSKRQSTVAEYFSKRYDVQLRYPKAPLVVVGSKKRPIHLPLEICHVIGGERLTKKLQPAQTASMIKHTAQKPHVRVDSVKAAFEERNYGGDTLISDFGIKVSNQMVSVQGRMLDPPRIMYDQSQANNQIQPRQGAWQSRNVNMFTCNELKNWGVLSLDSRCRENAIDGFVRVLSNTARENGFEINARPVMAPSPRNGDNNFQDVIMKAMQYISEQTGGEVQLLLVVLPTTDARAYGEIKRVCDTVIDVPSQCMLSKHVQKKNQMYCRNILLKINVKLGGINSVIDYSPSMHFLFRKPAIVFGCDVSHGAPGSVGASMAALVASMDAFPYRYETQVRSQESRKEVVTDLTSMAKELLLRFFRATNGKKPERILFYRDGVSEGQFESVLQFELAALRAACAELEPTYSPPVTFVVVQKRHHARFFCKNRGDSDRSGNVPPGTIVDSGVTHSRQWDFYLVSHAGIQGTSRPTHYHVIWDENGFTADVMQDLTNRMCYMYARCSRSVSVVPAVYYAHLAAFRARLHSRADDFDMPSSSASEGNVSVLPPVRDNNRKIMYFM